MVTNQFICNGPIYVGLNSRLLPIDPAICAFMAPEEVYVELVYPLEAGRYLAHIAEQPERLASGAWQELELSAQQLSSLILYQEDIPSYQVKQQLQNASFATLPEVVVIQAASSSPVKNTNPAPAPHMQNEFDVDQVEYRTECVIIPLEHLECGHTPDQPPRSQATIDRLLLRNCLHYLRDSRKHETKKSVRRALKRLESRIRRVFWLRDFLTVLHKLIEITPIFGSGARSTQIVACRIDIDVPIAA